jgi:hypothetical protein
MVNSVGARIKLFNQVTSENRAHLVRAHLTRWLARHGARLTPEQLAVVQEALTVITPAWYRSPRRTEHLAAIKALEEKMARVLSREDMGQALTVHADYIGPT